MSSTLGRADVRPVPVAMGPPRGSAPGTDEADGNRGPGALALVAAAALLAFMLLLPGHPERFVPESFLRLPLELPPLALALVHLQGRALGALRAAAVATLGALLVARLLDLGSYIAFDRAFSPLVELHLLGDGWNLASGVIGRGQAALAVAAALGALALLCAATWWATGALARARGTRQRATIAVAGLALAAGALGLAGERLLPERDLDAPAGADLVPELVDRTRRMARSIADQREFVAALEADPVGAGDDAPAFAALAGRDVVVVFVEAYGRSALELERFSGSTLEALDGFEARVAGAGLHVASGWLSSPIRGGRSWLAQASFAAGLTVDDQARFDRLLGSERRSLNRLFDAAGWRTSASMPAIVQAWPDGLWYDFDRTLDGHGSGYAGEPFDWVTMPDQYTLSAFERLVRQDPEASAPVMATIALISTHAPWTPIAEIVPWEEVGDGSIFDGTRRWGEPTHWTNPEPLRDMYAETVKYTLEVLGRYLETYAEDGFFVILGDHQPAAIVDGWGRTSDVPIHVVARDPDLLARLPEDVFRPGAVPDAATPSLPMGAMRELLSSAFETP